MMEPLVDAATCAARAATESGTPAGPAAHGEFTFGVTLDVHLRVDQRTTGTTGTTGTDTSAVAPAAAREFDILFKFTERCETHVGERSTCAACAV